MRMYQATIICDRCGKRNEAGDEALNMFESYENGKTDPNGDPYWYYVYNEDANVRRLHLCPTCAALAEKKLKRTLNNIFGF